MKIQRPDTFTLRLRDQGDGRPSLQSQMELIESESEFTEIISHLRSVAQRSFCLTKCFQEQSDSAREKYMSGITGMAALESYEDAWPMEAYARIYLNGTVRNTRWRERHKGRLRELRPVLKGNGSRKQEGKANKSTCIKGKRAMRPTSTVAERIVPGMALEEEPEDVDQRGDEAESRNAANTTLDSSIDHTVAEFLASMDPPQPELLPALIRAGVTDGRYLRALAADKSLRNYWFNDMETAGWLEQKQCVLLTKSLLASFGTNS